MQLPLQRLATAVATAVAKVATAVATAVFIKPSLNIIYLWITFLR
jgi:hypothetical protein